MGTVQPLNIIRLVGINDKYAAAEEYDTDVRKTNIVCSWHEKQYQKSRTRNLEVNFQESVDLSQSDFEGTTIDRSGERFLFTPRLQTFVAVQYSFALPGLEGSAMEGWFTPRVEWAYTSSIEWLGPEVPQATQSGYNLLNARFSYDFWDDRAQVALWSKNLLNQAYFVNVTPTVSTLGFLTRAYAAPRTYGGELSWRF